MKLLLIKIGKVWNAMRREGVWRGLARGVAGGWALLRMMVVLPGDILIITSGVGDSARYRAHHVAEELCLKGFRARVTVQDNPLLPLLAGRFRVFVFHRTLYMGAVRRLFLAAKARGATLVFEADDLVYDSRYLEHMDFYRQMQRFERLQYNNGVGGEILRDTVTRYAVTTTSFLADKLREEGKEVFVVTNKLCREDAAICAPLYEARSRRLDGTPADAPVTIGYFSGTISHNKDFATVVPALMTLLDRYPQLRLALFGPLDTSSAIAAYGDRVVRMPYVSRSRYWGRVASVDIAIAPLEIGNPFCEAKSELKFFEAGILGVPVVAAATRTFREAITEDVDGFTADTTDVWVDCLERLIKDPVLRRRIGEAARVTALTRYVTVGAAPTPYDVMLRRAVGRG